MHEREVGKFSQGGKHDENPRQTFGHRPPACDEPGEKIVIDPPTVDDP